MKHIKSFESNSLKSYWLLPTDDRFEASLKKIKCPQNVMDRKFLFNSDLRNKHKYVFIASYDKEIWNWNPYKGKNTDEYYEESNYKFKGAINIPEYEFSADKYNL